MFYIFLGPEPEPEPEINYYQRLLVHDEDEATEMVQEHLKEHPPESVYDEVLLPTLMRARRDAERGRVPPQDEAYILEVTQRVVDDIAEHDRRARATGRGTAEPAPRAPVVLACPARGVADKLALDMLSNLLLAENYQTEVLSSEALTSEVIEKVRAEEPAVACISAVPPGGLSQASYLCKRLRHHFPELTILVGRWGFKEDVQKMKDRLVEAGATKVVTSLEEMRREILPLLSLQKEPTEPAGRPLAATGAGS